jgi:hypothetical protein
MRQGTMELDLFDFDTIRDAFGNALGGPGRGNGSFFDCLPFHVRKRYDLRQ